MHIIDSVDYMSFLKEYIHGVFEERKNERKREAIKLLLEKYIQSSSEEIGNLLQYAASDSIDNKLLAWELCKNYSFPEIMTVAFAMIGEQLVENAYSESFTFLGNIHTSLDFREYLLNCGDTKFAIVQSTIMDKIAKYFSENNSKIYSITLNGDLYE